MRILALDSAVAHCSATLVADSSVLAAARQDLERDHTAILPAMVRNVLRQGGLMTEQLDAIAVTVGPGSFTGIRAGLALAHGLALASGRTLVGVTVGEALAQALSGLRDREVWCVIPSRRGRIFLDRGGQILSLAVADMPLPDGPIALAGPAANEMATRLAAQGADVMLTDAIVPAGPCIAEVARRRLLDELPSIPAQPLYVDPPEAKPRAQPATATVQRHADCSG